MMKYLFLPLAISLFAPSSFAQKRNLRPGDLYRIKSTGGGTISPDGGWFAYTLTSIDSAKNNRNTDIWMMKWDGSENIQLTNSPEAESNPQWSPDGKYISFVAARSGSTTQIYLLNRMGGEAIKLTDVKGELGEYTWSPDSKKIALLQRDVEDTSKEKKNKPWVIDRYHFKQDVAGYLYDKRRTHIYVFDVKEKKLDTLTGGNYDESSIQWSPDGNRIVFVSNRTEDPDKNENADIFTIEARRGASIKQLTTWKGTDSSPRWSPDGKSIAYLRSTADGNFIMYDEPILCTISADGGEPRLLSKDLDRPVGNPRWNKDGNAIAVLVTDDCRRYIATYDVNSGKMSRVIEGDRVFNSLEVHPGGNWITTMSDPQSPSEFYALENGSLRRLTRVQDEFVSSVNFASVQKVVSTSKDGNKVSNLLFTPPGSDGRKMPAVFYIHGGPVGQDDYGFDLTRQMLAANGYAVIGVNYRGSNGRGIAYSKAIEADWGNKEVLDILGAADQLTKSGVIDADNLGICGWSYGGILTDYSIASDTRFKAACSGAGSAMQLSLVGVDQYITQFENEIGYPWKDNNLEKYLKLSYPYLKADRIKTPTIFLTGEKDFNVPAVGSEQMYQALRSLGIPTELIVYPGQFHGITNPAYQKDRLERYNAWFDRYLKKEIILMMLVKKFSLVVVAAVLMAIANPLRAQSKLDAAMPIRGFAIGAPLPSYVDSFVTFIDSELAPRKVNVLILRVDYDYQYKTHPELRDSIALSEADVKKIVNSCRQHSIRIVPQINLLGHQSWASRTGKLLSAYPEFDETPEIIMPAVYQWPNADSLYCKSYCPLHPDVHKVVFDVVDELCDAFETDAFHAGMDEVFYIGSNNCPRCQGISKAKLFADEVKLIRDHLARSKRQLWIWGDRLIDGAATGVGMWEGSMNNTYPAIDMIPKDVMICDWHYERPDKTAPYFASKGFSVATCPWRDPALAITQLQDMIAYRHSAKKQVKSKYKGMIQTVWSRPNVFINGFYQNSRDPQEGDNTPWNCFRQLFDEINKIN